MLRKLSSRATLYTEMVTANTIAHCPESELPRFLELPDANGGSHPTVLQVGGSDPEMLRKAAAIAAPWGYDAINLNCGCPSDRVAGKGCFGAAMMKAPELVAACCGALAEGAPGLPITVKCRIGVVEDRRLASVVDDDAVYSELRRFVDVVSSQSPVRHFVVHARRAVLGGLSPAQNRQVPPLRYNLIHRLAADFPALRFSLNGGLDTYETFDGHLGGGSALAGVMVGRAVCSRPWYWATVDSRLYGAASDPAGSRRQLLHEYCAWADSQEAQNPQRIRHLLLAPTLNLFAGEPYGKKYRAAMDAAQKEAAAGGGSISSLVLGVAEGTLRADTLDAPPGAEWDLNGKEYVMPGAGAAGVEGTADGWADGRGAGSGLVGGRAA